MKNTYILLCFFLSLNLVAQKNNLIPNSSFENYTTCNKYLTPILIDSLLNWFVPSKGTTDYFNTCLNKSNNRTTYGIPNNLHGYQPSKTGNAYIGLIPFLSALDPQNGWYSYREYISIRLKRELETERVYLLSFYISLANKATTAVSMNDIGIYFSKDSIFMPLSLNQYGVLPFKPQAVAGKMTTFIEDTTNWLKLSFKYQAKGEESYITIGNFNNDTKTNHIIVDSNANSLEAYYYIDDVSLYEIIPQDIAVIEIKSNLKIGRASCR